jgi:hypothetical protein
MDLIFPSLTRRPTEVTGTIEKWDLNEMIGNQDMLLLTWFCLGEDG